jgi:hypothetical protein
VVVVPVAKLKISWTSVGVIADDGTSTYTEKMWIKESNVSVHRLFFV